MRLLLDTHTFLWWLFDDPKLPDSARRLLADSRNRVHVSAASVWEICTKHRLGKLDAAGALVRDVPGWIRKAGFIELPITAAHAQLAGSFPQPHRDPFDRMLAAQSMTEDLPVVSRDGALAPFDIQLLW
jgi:PIN domain nuclease of toxin-antitoxin system